MVTIAQDIPMAAVTRRVQRVDELIIFHLSAVVVANMAGRGAGFTRNGGDVPHRGRSPNHGRAPVSIQRPAPTRERPCRAYQLEPFCFAASSVLVLSPDGDAIELLSGACVGAVAVDELSLPGAELSPCCLPAGAPLSLRWAGVEGAAPCIMGESARLCGCPVSVSVR
jgi:hypothetical protein